MSRSHFCTYKPCCTFWRSPPLPSPYWSSVGCAKHFSLPWQTTWDCCVFKHRVCRSYRKKWKSSESNASRSLTRYLADAWDGAKLHHMVSQGTKLLCYTFMLFYLQLFSWWFNSAIGVLPVRIHLRTIFWTIVWSFWWEIRSTTVQKTF